MNQLTDALGVAGLKIGKYDPSKTRCITINTGGTLSVDSFIKRMSTLLGPKLSKFPELFEAFHDVSKLVAMLEEHCRKEGTLHETKKVVIEIPEYYEKLTLNLDQSHAGRELQFFMTTPEETISHIAGPVYLRVCGIPEEEAISRARKVVPEYLPRSERGVVKKRTINGEETDVFNKYIPPTWIDYQGETKDSLPRLFRKLVNHVFPIEIERQYFFDWLHASLFSRAYVYLILCGKGGVGKNTLKKVLRALHGHQNAVDGKKSSLTEKFNSQLSDATLVWFDELSYDMDMENAMKEIQNDTIAIERKGVDATRSTRIYASCVISNNKPRDNYIAFDARKFVPLVLNTKRLETSLTKEEIDELVSKVEDWSSPTFDVKFLAQIGRWIQKNGNPERWNHLEYKGPMFYKLAHTSMSRWQKKAAQIVLETKPTQNGRIIFNEQRGFLWSSVAEAVQRTAKGDRSMQFPDFSTVQHFFDVFVDAHGEKAFETSVVPESIMGDFWVKVVKKNAKILTELEVVKEIRGNSGEEEDRDEDIL